MRILWFALGCAAVALGAAGAALPLLPTVPFLLLAALCFARSSPVAEAWLLAHPRLGPPIADWRAGGVIRRPAKRAAALAMLASLAMPLALGAPLWVTLAQALALAAVAAFVLTRPEAPPDA